MEYAVKTGSAEWNVTSGQSQLTGVTQVTKCTRYEADATSTAQQDSPCGLNTHVAHFGFPVELELEAQHSPEPSQWPTVYKDGGLVLPTPFPPLSSRLATARNPSHASRHLPTPARRWRHTTSGTDTARR